MEEQKTSKEVKMEPVNTNVQDNQEDLQKVCDDLYNHNKQLEAYIQRLHKQMQQMDITLQTTRLSFLFKVVELSANEHSMFRFDSKFVETCVEEIQQSLTIPEDVKEETKKK